MMDHIEDICAQTTYPAVSLPASQDRFPPEIYAAIIAFVAKGDNETFSSVQGCGLVSHTFLHLARSHLFSSIRINCIGEYHPRPSGSFGAANFVQLLSHTPNIAQYVRTLKFSVDSDDFSVDGLVAALKMLSKVKSLTIVPSRPMRYLNWSLFPLRDAFVHLFPTLSHLALRDTYDFNPIDLSLCTSLKDLAILDLNVTPLHITLPKKLPLLERLSTDIYDINSVDNLFTVCGADGMRAMDLSALRSLELIISRNLWDETKNLMKLEQCKMLNDIKIQAIKWTTPTILQGFAYMAIPFLQTLQHLHFLFRINEVHEDPLAGLAAELLAISAENNIIRCIEIVVWVETDRDCKRGVEWAPLNEVFTREQSRWRDLKTVSLKITVSSRLRRDRELEEALRKLPEEQWKELMSSNNIKFEFEVASHGHLRSLEWD